MDNSDSKFTTVKGQIIVALLGAVASIVVAWITATANAKPAAEQVIDERVQELNNLRKHVDILALRTQAIDKFMRFSVVAFNSRNCPIGWRAFEPGRGRYVVGLIENGTLGAVVGSDLRDKENRSVGKHSHTYERFYIGGNAADKSDAIKWGDANDAMRQRTEREVSDAGLVEGTNAPYVQLLLCERVGDSLDEPTPF